MALPVALPEGHSPDVVHASIRALAPYMSHQSACLCALREARKWWRMEYPRGAYPAHLRKKPKSKAQREKKSKYIEEIR